MSMRRGKASLRAIALGLVLAAGAAPIAAQDPGDTRMTRIRAELPAAAVQRIEAQVAQARLEGLPVGPLLDKAIEGIAKGVPGDRIAGAVSQVAGELGRARALLAGGTPPAAGGAPPAAVDVAAVADALRRGVPETAIGTVARGARPGEPVALAVHTLGDLLDRGVPADQALAVLEAWRDGGSDPDALREVPSAIERLIQRGTLPSQAAAAIMGAMQGGGPPGLNGAQPGGRRGPPDGPPIPPGAGPPDDRGKGSGKGKPPGGGGPPGGL